MTYRILLAASVLAGASAARAGQIDEWRRPSTEPFDLPGGSRVEFSSIESEAIHGTAEYSVFLPPAYRGTDRRFPVVYFLHGLFNDHTSWTVDHEGDIPALLDDLMSKGSLPQLILVHPNGARSFYTDYKDGSLRYETMIVEELPRHVEARYRVATGPNRRAIAGTSMGGYGALKIAMRHPDRYRAVAAHSAIVFPVKNPLDAPAAARSSRQFQFVASVFAAIYGDPLDQEYFDQNNPLELAAQPGIRGLGIYFDYGTADRYDASIGLGKGLAKLDQTLSAHGVPHTFHTYEGEPHGWALVYAHIAESLKFLGEYLDD
jgi:S-formylglutathione hydrolase FrmB